ncbi:MAG: 3'-5' exonuclease [Xanthomonadales bacterium]|nr:3'-5' exonuclease [Xanthomonadales bacterium]
MLFERRKTDPATDWPLRLAELAEASEVELLERFYARGTVAAQTPLSEVPLVALDLETTGLNPERHGIVSLGLVPFTLSRIRMNEAYYRVVRPRRELEERSVTIHQITHEDLDEAPDLAELAETLLEALAGRVVVVHYHAIERRFLHRAFARRFGEGVLFPLIDTLAIEKQITQRITPNPLTWFGNRRVSLRLADARRRYHLPQYSPHHALTDALATAELFQAQVAYHGSPEDPVAEWWL